MTEQSLVAAHPAAPALLRRSESQRARLLMAVVDVVGEKGLARTLVADIVREAGVSRSTFYDLFTSKEDCFIQSYRYYGNVILEQMEAAVRAADGDWKSRLRAGLRAYLSTLEGAPFYARTHLLEIHYAGDRGQAEREVTLRRVTDALILTIRSQLPNDPRVFVPSADALFVLASGIDQLVSSHVREGRIHEIPELEDTLVSCAVAAILGASLAAGG